jgi:hypothetical protein
MSDRKTVAKKAAADKSRATTIERQLREYYADFPHGDNDEADLRLTELVSSLLYHSPARQQLAVAIYRACAKAWDAARDMYGHANMMHPTERAIVHDYHELLVALINALEPLPLEQQIQRELEIYGAGADFQTKATINRALKSGNRQTMNRVLAQVSVYGHVETKRKRAKGGAR